LIGKRSRSASDIPLEQECARPNSVAPSDAWKASLFYLKLLKRPSESLRWFAEMFLVARLADRRFFQLLASLDFLYDLLRPIRLTLRWSGLFLLAGFRWLRQWFRFSSN